jgi:hypothetical protein
MFRDTERLFPLFGLPDHLDPESWRSRSSQLSD